MGQPPRFHVHAVHRFPERGNNLAYTRVLFGKIVFLWASASYGRTRVQSFQGDTTYEAYPMSKKKLDYHKRDQGFAPEATPSRLVLSP